MLLENTSRRPSVCPGGKEGLKKKKIVRCALSPTNLANIETELQLLLDNDQWALTLALFPEDYPDLYADDDTDFEAFAVKHLDPLKAMLAENVPAELLSKFTIFCQGPAFKNAGIGGKGINAHTNKYYWIALVQNSINRAYKTEMSRHYVSDVFDINAETRKRWSRFLDGCPEAWRQSKYERNAAPKTEFAPRQ